MEKQYYSPTLEISFITSGCLLVVSGEGYDQYNIMDDAFERAW